MNPAAAFPSRQDGDALPTMMGSEKLAAHNMSVSPAHKTDDTDNMTKIAIELRTARTNLTSLFRRRETFIQRPGLMNFHRRNFPLRANRRNGTLLVRAT